MRRDKTARECKVETLPTHPACGFVHSELTGLAFGEEATMNDAGTQPRHMLDIRELTAEAFAPYGQVIAPLRTGGQGAETSYDPEASAGEAKLVLGNGEPRLWIMHLPHVGLGFTRIARHRRVTQCLGSLGGKEWLIGVAPPGDLGDDARPRVEDICRLPGAGRSPDQIACCDVARRATLRPQRMPIRQPREPRYQAA
jgi:hypothetical protein